jgi:hypothetical protein
MNLNLIYLRKIFEQIGGGPSIIGGGLGYGIGLTIQSNCSDFAIFIGSCPNPLVIAVVGAGIGLLSRLFK